MIDDRPAAADVERSEHPLKIALVYCRNPLPMRNADQITVAHLIEFLSARGHLVDLYCLSGDGKRKSDNTLTADGLAWLEERCHKVTHVQRARRASILGAVGSLLTGKPLQVGWFSSRRLSKALSITLNDAPYDVMYAYYFRSAKTLLDAVKRSGARAQLVPTVLAMQLSQTLNTRRIRDNATNIATRLLFGLESWLISRYEAHIWTRFDRTALIGPADVEAISSECRALGLPVIDNWFYSPHGTDISRFRPRPTIKPAPKTVLFAGTLFYPPNIQAAVWLANSIWPRVHEQVPDARLRIVGRDPAPEVIALASEAAGVEVIGNVPDLSEYMLEAAVCVNPVRAAGGMQNKLIEYLASGRPVVATNIANEGIRAPRDVLKLADGADEFADAIASLLLNQPLAEDMGRQAREYARQEWSWEAHFLTLESNLTALASAGSITESTDVD